MEETKIIQVSSLPTRITHYVNSNSNIKDRVSETEYQLIINALDKNGWDVKGKEKAAKELGLSLRTLYRKLKM
jgi:transcriptional regulator with PAS, ATPase and Fis domain